MHFSSFLVFKHICILFSHAKSKQTTNSFAYVGNTCLLDIYILNMYTKQYNTRAKLREIYMKWVYN